MPLGNLAAQLAHAASECIRTPCPPNTHAVILAASGEEELLCTFAKLTDAGIDCTLIREPDAPFNGAATAIGCAPQPRQQLRRLLSGLPLLR